MDPHPQADRLERLAAAAWPPEVRRPLGPWILRATHGVTSRANSVFTAPAYTADASDNGDVDADPLICEAESFYADLGLPPTFHLSPATEPRHLDQLLAGRGYEREKPSQVWTASLADAPATIAPMAGGRDVGGGGTRVPDAAWCDCALGPPSPARAVMEQITARIVADTWFVAVRDGDGTAISCGAAVLDGGWIGIYSMATRPSARGQGLASRVLAALLAWGRARGATGAYLQVLADNAPAHRLYTRAGFRFAYPYHYRVKQTTAP